MTANCPITNTVKQQEIINECSKAFNFDNFNQVIKNRQLKFIIIIIITKIYIAHMPDGKINLQIESEAHKKVNLTNV